MRRAMSGLAGGVLAAMLVILGSGCAGPTQYAKAGMFGYGYRDGEYEPGKYIVYFIGQKCNFDFVKDAALYRSAELTYEKGYRYFTIIKTEDHSTSTPGVVGQRGPMYIPGIALTIKCYKAKPEGAESIDAYNFLNKNAVPGTDEIISINARKKGVSTESKEKATSKTKSRWD